MCNPALAIMGMQAVSTGVSAYGQYQQGVAQQKMYNAQADAAAQQGQQVLKTAEMQTKAIQDTAKVQGKRQAESSAQALASQKAAMAAMGMDPSSVTAADITMDTVNKTKLDENLIRYNADVKSWETETAAANDNWALQTQSDQYRIAAKNAKTARNINVFSTLLGGAAQTGMAGYQMGAFSSKTKWNQVGIN